MPSKVFVSYTRHDEALVTPLAKLLDLAAEGSVSVFLDVTSLRPGDRWQEKIEEAIRDATLFVLCWCCESPVSRFIAHEISMALRDPKKRLVPVLFCPTPLPSPLSDWQWIDLRGKIVHVCNNPALHSPQVVPPWDMAAWLSMYRRESRSADADAQAAARTNRQLPGHLDGKESTSAYRDEIRHEKDELNQ